MNLRELEVFNALMKAGTTVGAAEALHLSQPAVSKILKHLESSTGVRLFERVGGRLRPTPDGHALYRHVRTVFQRLETIERVTQDIRDGRNGSVSVAAAPTIGTTLLAEAVVRFRRLYPDARVIFRSIRTLDVARRVTDGEADFGLVHIPVDKSGLKAEDLLPTEIVCVVPRQHKLAAQPFVSLQDLTDYPLVSYRPGTGVGGMIAAAFRAEGIDKPIDIQTSLSATACVLAAQGTAVALTDPLPFLLADQPGLVMRPVRPSLQVSVQLLLSREFPASGLAERLLYEVRSVAAEMAQRFTTLCHEKLHSFPAKARSSR